MQQKSKAYNHLRSYAVFGLHRASAGVHLLGLRRCQTGDAQIDQQLDTKSVRQHHRLYHPFRFAGEQTKRAAAFTALALGMCTIMSASNFGSVVFGKCRCHTPMLKQ